MTKQEIRVFIWSLLIFVLWAVAIFGGYLEMKERLLFTFGYAIWVGLDAKIDVLLEKLEEKKEKIERENFWGKKLP